MAMGCIARNSIPANLDNLPALSRLRSLLYLVNYLAHFMAFLYGNFRAGIEAIWMGRKLGKCVVHRTV